MVKEEDLPTIEGTYRVIAEVYRHATAEALRGDEHAIVWLDYVAPDWRERWQKARDRERKYQRRYIVRESGVIEK